MAATFKTPVRAGVVHAADLFAVRRAPNHAPLTCVWRRDAEGRLVRVWGRQPRPPAAFEDPAPRAAAA